MDEPPAAGLLAMSSRVRLAPWLAAMRGAAMVERLSAGTASFCSRRDMTVEMDSEGKGDWWAARKEKEKEEKKNQHKIETKH